MEKITSYYAEPRHCAWRIRLVRGAEKAELAGTITMCPPSALSDLWTRRFPDPLTAFASGWMHIRARARQYGVALPLVISDHADWDGLTRPSRRPAPAKSGSRTARKTRWCIGARRAASKPGRSILSAMATRTMKRHRRQTAAKRRYMNRFAELLDRLAYEPARNAKLRLITDYFRSTPDPERGWALAALTGSAEFSARQSRPHPQPDRRAHRSGVVRTVLRLRRRSFGNSRADVAGAAGSADSLPPWGEGWGGGSGGDALALTTAVHLPTPTPIPSPQGGGEQRAGAEELFSPPLLKRSPPSARPNCQRGWRAGSMRSTKPAAGRSSNL